MRWNLQYARHVRFYEQLAAKGQPTPLSEMPVVSDIGVEWYLSMFRMLEASRNQNGYINIESILAVANNFELIGTKREFVSIIQALDDVYVEHHRKEDERRHSSQNRT